ncbi:hypothetical protein [uncultured Treponema sp.]|uniref:hypothetical protein n=1 Tax=uncultured Treponema sp. TaxID=162155 RepID=UPI00258AB882|nr:hypothetical protein [uncultured Treponema sp.]
MGNIISRKQAAGQIRKTLESFYMLSRSVPGEGATGENDTPELERFFILCGKLGENIRKKEYDTVLDSLDAESFRSFYHTVGILAESYNLHNAKYFKENEPAGITGDVGDTNGNLYHYAGNSPIKYNDPNKIEDYSIIKMGGYKRKLSSEEIFDRLKNTEDMGRAYSTVAGSVFVCTTFVSKDLKDIGLDVNDYLPGGQKVVDSISILKENLYSGLFQAEESKNPGEGTYIFYFDYGDGTGHTGFVNFDKNGNATILHNGGSNEKCVNLYNRDNRDFYTWFQSEGTLYYKKIEMEEWVE